MRLVSLFIVFFGFCIFSVAQSGNSSLQLGIGMSGVSYIGDLTDEETALSRVSPGGGITVQFNGDAIVQPYLAAGFGRFTEQSDNIKFEPIPNLEPNTFVETSFFYADLRLKARLFPKGRVQPYISSGIGLTFFNPKDDEGNFLGENIFTRLEEESYSTTIASFPVTVGVQARLNQVLGLGIDYTYRITPTDYLDNIGLLGNRDGNDALHGVQVTLYFILEGPDEVPLPIQMAEKDSLLALEEKAKSTKSDQTAAQDVVAGSLDPLSDSAEDLREKAEEALSTSLAIMLKDKKEPVVAAVGNENGNENKNENEETVEVAGNEKVEVENPVEENPEKVEVAEVVDDGIDWLAIEIAALENRDFVYYPVKRDDQLSEILAKFNIRKETVKSINHMVNDDVFIGSYLRLPNMGIPIE